MDSELFDNLTEVTKTWEEKYAETHMNVEFTCPWCSKKRTEEVSKADKLDEKSVRTCRTGECDRLWNRNNDIDGYRNHLRIPQRYRDCSFETFKTDSNIIKELRDIIDAGDYSNPILFSGQTTGTGKTHLAIATLLEVGKKTSVTLKLINFSMLMGEIFSAIKSAHDESVEDVVKDYSDKGILCIDDLGAEHTTTYSTSILYRILNNRYNTMKMTIVTTNLEGKEICAMYDRRILSRLSCGHVFTLAGKDKRIGSIKNVTI